MKSLLAIIQSLAFASALCSATSTVPFKPRAMTVDYGMGRAATFTFEPSRLEMEINKGKEDHHKAAFSFDHTEKPKVEKPERDWTQPGTRIVSVEFTFSNGLKASVAEVDLNDIEIIEIDRSEIETLSAEGSWALSVKIKNLQEIPDRVADDRVVFIFKNHQYSKRRLEINYKWNAKK